MDKPQLTWIAISHAAERKTIEDHALVLEARGIGNAIAVDRGYHVLLVRFEDVEQARAELYRYDRENDGAPPGEDAPQPLERSIVAAAVYAITLVAFDAASRRGFLGLDWWHAGLSDAAAIQAGAWWRAVTALFLHADALHLAGNVIFGCVFGVMLAQSVGYGVCWLGFVLAGGLGNGLNGLIQTPSHASIGASTAVFGVLGIQAAHDWMRRRQLHHNLFRRWAPIAVGAALLAWLGGDGRQIDPTALPPSPGRFEVALPRIDVGAHVLGFAFGLAIGGFVGWKKRWLTSARWIQTALAGVAVATIVLAWWLALT